MAAIIHGKYFRHRLYSRVRHRRHLSAFLTAESAALTSTASAQVVTPKHTTNTKGEALIVFATNPANADTLTIGNFTYKFVTALTEVAATGTLTNDGTDVTALDTVTIDGHVYTFKSALTEVKATNGFVISGTNNLLNGETVTIDGRVYTAQDTLTAGNGHFLIGADKTASYVNLARAINQAGAGGGTLYDNTVTPVHATVVASEGPPLGITAKTAGVAANSISTTTTASHGSWTTATLTGGVDPIANEVLRGVSNTASMTALFEAINGGANAGTDYSSNTVAHATVTATNPTGTTVVVKAKTDGTAGNAIATTEASTHLSWGGTTLSGGVAPAAGVYEVKIQDTAAHTRDKTVLAITNGAGGGTDYSDNTPVHDKVTAAASGGDLLVTMLNTGTTDNPQLVKLSKSSSHLTLPASAALDGPLWTATGHAFVDGEGPVLLTNSGGALPAGSLTTELWVHVVDANTIALATSLEALRKGNFMQTTSAGTGTHSVTRAVTKAGIFDLLKRNKPRTVAAASDVDSLK